MDSNDRKTKMRRLVVKNIGPISSVELDIRRVNVIIGPQSSGKSTIAKILSFCLWLEKDVVAHQEKEYINSAFIKTQLLDYHKLGNYINDGAFIQYVGPYINFSFRTIDDFTVELTKDYPKSLMSKVGYVPAERNLTSVSGISGLTMERDYVRDYLFDWFNLHLKYEQDNGVGIPDLGVEYYYDEERKTDIIRLENGKELTISEVSSGLQSIVPLYVSYKYTTSWVFEHEEAISYDRYSILTKALIRAISPDLDDEKVNQALQLPTLMTKLQESLSMILKNDYIEGLAPEFKQIAKLRDRLMKPHFACMIVEEPEQNLFPKTQVSLVYDMLRMMTRNEDLLLMTTHSPYTLYALNNCMLGDMVKNTIDAEETENLPSRFSWINGNEVSIWQLSSEGTIQDLKDPRTGLVGKHYFNDVMNETLDEYHTMIDYLDL